MGMSDTGQHLFDESDLNAQDDTGQGDGVRMKIDDQAGVSIFTIHEKDVISQSVVESFGKQLSQRLLRTARPKFIIDLSMVESISSRMLGELIAMQVQLEASGGRMVIAGMTPPVREVFAVTKLDRRVPIYTDIDEAIASFHRS